METPRIVATVECRMTSTRLPGKVMLKSCGKPMLQHIADRLSRVPKIDQVVLATTTNPTDDCIAALAREIGVGCFRGSEDDVLSRVLQAAKAFEADVIAEITGDCPLIDPDITGQTLDLFLLNDCDYASNDLIPAFPLGMDVEVFSTSMLQVADREGQSPADREHVSWFFVRNPQRFRLLTLPAPPSLYWPDLRLTLDESADFILIDQVFKALYFDNPAFGLPDIITWIKNNPELALINAKVVQRNPSNES
jgi:spore coat polysaccharide biosynthesis protein SpsF